MRHGYPKPTLAVGPMLKVDQNLQRRFNLARTRSLYRSFGSETVVVSRGGYNTCWEAVAAGSLFISCGSHQGDENVKARAAFLQHAGLGRTASLSTEALFDAIARPRSRREVQSLADWSDVINAGLPVMIDELLGGSFLRARENATVRGAQDIRRLVRHRKRHHGSKLVARFYDVSPSRMTDTLARSVRHGHQMHYRCQLHVLRCNGSNVDPGLVSLADEAAELWAHVSRGPHCINWSVRSHSRNCRACISNTKKNRRRLFFLSRRLRSVRRCSQISRAASSQRASHCSRTQRVPTRWCHNRPMFPSGPNADDSFGLYSFVAKQDKYLGDSTSPLNV
jgi:hypothetical protein